jgi:hypothetical protein
VHCAHNLKPSGTACQLPTAERMQDHHAYFGDKFHQKSLASGSRMYAVTAPQGAPLVESLPQMAIYQSRATGPPTKEPNKAHGVQNDQKRNTNQLETSVISESSESSAEVAVEVGIGQTLVQSLAGNVTTSCTMLHAMQAACIICTDCAAKSGVPSSYFSCCCCCCCQQRYSCCCSKP